ncbi:MAG: ChaN family lipoprotein [Rhodobacteraceae bacterium]|nr:ChaN family lipoprotein [Alphaproteobacteria bacterium]MBT8476973.1 ChaN family lipoprotein [Alphaproteobacteria bacterium]NNK68213.1 ChaN family lipoprotein [Paracoccaceae bacterium]
MTLASILPRAAAALAALCVSAVADEIDATDLYDLPAADVVILGEVHDNPTHHAHQALAIDAMKPRAIVFEMLTDRQALRITPALLSDEAALGRALGWEDSGWPDFAMYYPIFAAGKDAAFFGGAIPGDEVRRAVSDGAASVFGAAAPIFGLDNALDELQQVLREAMQLSAHCDALPASVLPGMVEAQRLRDAGLARAVLAAMAETGGPVAVITGNGHARRDWGIPAALEAAAPDLSILSIGQFETSRDGPQPFDLWLVTDPEPREDPCIAFKSR